MVLLVFEGQIGVGKSTFSTLLCAWCADKGIPHEFFAESVDAEMLALFYKDPERYGAIFQQRNCADRFLILDRAYRKSRERPDMIVICDTGIVRDSVFAASNMAPDIYQAYQKLYYDNVRRLTSRYDVLVYLDASTDTCLERIKMRNRDCESNIQRNYLEKIDANYKYHLLQPELARIAKRVWRLDWNELPTQIGEWAEDLLDMCEYDLSSSEPSSPTGPKIEC